MLREHKYPCVRYFAFYRFVCMYFQVIYLYVVCSIGIRFHQNWLDVFVCLAGTSRGKQNFLVGVECNRSVSMYFVCRFMRSQLTICVQEYFSLGAQADFFFAIFVTYCFTGKLMTGRHFPDKRSMQPGHILGLSWTGPPKRLSIVQLDYSCTIVCM